MYSAYTEEKVAPDIFCLFKSEETHITHDLAQPLCKDLFAFNALLSVTKLQCVDTHKTSVSWLENKKNMSLVFIASIIFV